MTETQMIAIALAMVASLFGLLSVIVGWIGARVVVKLDVVVDSLNSVAGELHTRINGIDNRLTRVETKVERT